MRRMNVLALVALLVISACDLMAQSETQNALSGNQIIERVSPSAVLILVGNGDGQVAGVGSGVILRPDGVILTANHVVKGMREVQIRLKNGEVYDQVELIAADERRDVAALRIPATALPVLAMGNAASVPVGAPVFAVSNAAGLPWTASSGILSATRMADEVAGAGSGYGLLQFTAPMSPGSSGGVLVDAEARILGMIEAMDEYDAGPRMVSVLAEQLAAAVMIPAEALEAPKTPLGGSSLTTRPPPVTPADILRAATTIFVESHTIWMKGNLLQDALYLRPEIRMWGMRIVEDRSGTDIYIYIDITRPFLTYDWEYKMIHPRSGTVLGTGKVLAVDGPAAAQRLAIDIVNRIRSVRPPAPQKAP